MDKFRQGVESLRATWAALPAATRAVVALLAIALCAVVAWGFRAAPVGPMTRVADAATDPGTRARIVAKLAELKVPHRVEDGAVLVPAARADEAVLQLHGAGALGDGQVFEFIKESNPFASQWDRDKRWQVALQQQLARMIGRMGPVRAVSVQVTPQQEMATLWAGRAEATAAVMVELKDGAELSKANVKAICGLVAAAVQGLKPSNVKIGDSSGRLYGLPSSDATVVGHDLREQEVEYAHVLEEKARNLLPDGAKVSITVRLSPEERSTEKRSVDRQGADVETSTQSTRELGPDGKPAKESTQATTRSDHGATVEKTQAPLGTRIESVSVAVVLPVEAGATGGEAEGRRAVQEYTALLARATGADEGSVSVMPVPMSRPVFVAPAAPPVEAAGASWGGHALIAGALLLLALIAWGALRSIPMTTTVTSEESVHLPGGSLPAEEAAELDRIKDGVRASAGEDPRGAAEVLRRWMR